MKKDVCIIMAKKIVYTGANDFIVNKVIYLLDNDVPIGKLTTQDFRAAKDIAALCAAHDVDTISLYGPIAIMNKLKDNIMKRSANFKNKDIQFSINIGF